MNSQKHPVGCAHSALHRHAPSCARYELASTSCGQGIMWNEDFCDCKTASRWAQELG